MEDTKMHSVASPLRKQYTQPTVTRVPLVAEELLVASCVKTPNICHFHGPIQQIKS
jgi:hypothetical protein